jgi:hypothetical protein
MQVRERKLIPSALFCGVTNGKTHPLGQVKLPVTFGGRDNFRKKNIMFDVVHFNLPYNAILGALRSPNSWPRSTTPTASS